MPKLTHEYLFLKECQATELWQGLRANEQLPHSASALYGLLRALKAKASVTFSANGLTFLIFGKCYS